MKDAFFVYTRDHEDSDLIGFSCAIPIPEEHSKTYEGAVNFLKPILSSPEFVAEMIKKDCLEDDESGFDGKPYEFAGCAYRNYMLEYDFRYAGDDEGEDDYTHQKSMNFIKVV